MAIYNNKQTDQDLETPEHQLKQSKLLLDLTKLEAIDEGQVEESLRQITKAAAEGLEVERSSVWLYNEARDAIVCVALYDSLTKTHQNAPITLKACEFPAYFKYLAEERTLPAHDASTNPATCEFSEVYLKPLNIHSMLDAPIRKRGVTIGVICNEKVGSKRIWSLTDQAFAGATADFISRAFISKDRVQAQESLKSINENLEKLVESRTRELEAERAANFQSAKMVSLGMMSAGIAHEINTPLASLQLVSGMLISAAESQTLDTSFVAKAAKRIEVTTERISKIIKCLKTFSRDAVQDPTQRISVKELIDDTVLLCHERFRLSGVTVEVINMDYETSIDCRAVEIQQVLINLLNNAFDAIVAREEKWIRIEAKRIGTNIEIAVTDSGPGISEDIRSKIMDPFFTTKGVGKGTGLGLSVSCGLVQSNRGTLNLDVENKNTSFKMTLPEFQSSNIGSRLNGKNVA